MKDSTKVLYKSIQSRYVKVTWSHKIQEKQGDIYADKSKKVKSCICILSTLTSGGAVSSIFQILDPQIVSILTATFALILSYYTIRYKDGQLDEKSKENKIIAAKLHNLRNKYESLMTEIIAELHEDMEIVKKKDELEQQENTVYMDTPCTTRKAVKQAERALKTNKESTTEEEEIEAIVPKELIIH